MGREHADRLCGPAAESPVRRQAWNPVAAGHSLPLQFAVVPCFLNYTIADDLQMVSRERILFFYFRFCSLNLWPEVRATGRGGVDGGTGFFAFILRRA